MRGSNLRPLITRDGKINRVLTYMSDITSRHGRRGSLTALLTLAIGRFRLRLLGVEWQERYSLLELWRL